VTYGVASNRRFGAAALRNAGSDNLRDEGRQGARPAVGDRGVRTPHLLAGEKLIGTYVIVHDEGKMTRGEPCTALYRVGTRRRPLEEVVSFHCIPRERKAVPSFTTTVISNPAFRIDTFDTLTEFQFAGDSEGHAVPIAALARASDRRHGPESVVCAR
jgi:hypothetical protein